MSEYKDLCGAPGSAFWLVGEGVIVDPVSTGVVDPLYIERVYKVVE